MERDYQNVPEDIEDPRTPEDILRDTATQFNTLDQTATEALHHDRDVPTYKLRMRDRARLLIELPFKLQEAVDRGEVFPEEAMRKIKDFSAHATEMLATDNDFGLGVLLIPKGSKIGDPNQLERLINTLYPPKDPPSGSKK